MISRGNSSHCPVKARCCYFRRCVVGSAKLERSCPLSRLAFQKDGSGRQDIKFYICLDRCDERNVVERFPSLQDIFERDLNTHRSYQQNAHMGERVELDRKGGRISRTVWSGKRDLNPRPSPWQGDALPLSYSRSQEDSIRGGILLRRACTVKQLIPRNWLNQAAYELGHKGLSCYQLVARYICSLNDIQLTVFIEYVVTMSSPY